MTRPHADRSQCSEKSRFMDSSPVRRLIRMTEKSRQIRQMPQRIHRKCVKRPSAVADWVTVTVTYGRPRLLCGRKVQENSGSVVQKEFIDSHHEKFTTNQISQRGHRPVSHINCHRRSSEAYWTAVCVPMFRSNRVSYANNFLIRMSEKSRQIYVIYMPQCDHRKTCQMSQRGCRLGLR